LQEDLLKKLLETLRIQRHDFMNHLQVISGYLQLGNLAKAQEYTLKAVDSVETFGKLSKIPLPYLQSYLLWLSAQYPQEVQMFMSEGDWQEWQEKGDALDQELTGLLLKLYSAVEDSLKKQDLKCSLVFKDNYFLLNLFFVGEKANINSIINRINQLNKLNASLKLLSVACKENSSEKLEILISLQ